MSHATTESDHQTADVLMSLMSGKTKSNVAEPSSSPPPFPCNGGSSQNDDISADPKTASGDSSGEAHKGSVEDDEPVAENPKEPLPEQADSLERPRLDKYFFKLPHHRPLSKELAFEILTNVSIMPDAPSRPSASPFDRRFNFAYVGASKTPANLQRGPEDAANEISVSFQSIANSEPWWSQHVHDGMRLGIVARHMSRRSRVQVYAAVGRWRARPRKGFRAHKLPVQSVLPCAFFLARTFRGAKTLTHGLCPFCGSRGGAHGSTMAPGPGAARVARAATGARRWSSMATRGGGSASCRHQRTSLATAPSSSR